MLRNKLHKTDHHHRHGRRRRLRVTRLRLLRPRSNIRVSSRLLGTLWPSRRSKRPRASSRDCLTLAQFVHVGGHLHQGGIVGARDDDLERGARDDLRHGHGLDGQRGTLRGRGSDRR